MSIAIITTVVLVGCSTLLSFYVRHQVNQFNAIKEQVADAKARIEQVHTYMHLMDMGVRGYLLVQDDQMLVPYHEGYKSSLPNIDTLGMILKDQGYPNVETNQTTRKVIAKYKDILSTMIQWAESGQPDRALAMLKSDPGYDAWVVYSEYLDDAKAFEDTLYEGARYDYQQIVDLSTIMQVLLVVLGVPTLLFVLYRIRKANKARNLLFEELESSQRKYLFDDKSRQTHRDERITINQLTENLERASRFIGQISQGDYSVAWEGITNENQQANQENLAGALIHMREQMKEMKREDQQRLWSTEGL